jgi:hypothetical protein
MADRNPHHLTRVLSIGVIALVLASCGNTRSAAPVSKAPTTTAVASRLVLGSPEPGLQFTVKERPTNTQEASPVGPVSSTPPTASSANDAALQFGEAIVDNRTEVAFALLTTDEQARLGSVARFRDSLSREAPWQAVSLEPSSGANAALLRVSLSPSIDEIRGVVPAAATVRLPVVNEVGAWRIRWERRQFTPTYVADERRLGDDVKAWAQARQRSCEGTRPDSEYSGGLVGIVGLADSLCSTKGEPVVADVGDIYRLDDPQPLLDAFGSASFDWARVVSLSAPTPMDVIAAPVGDRWLVVGVAPSRLPAA